MAPRSRSRPRSRRPAPPEGATPITYQGETAFYTERELKILAAMKATAENENAAKVIHAAKVHLDATLVE